MYVQFTSCVYGGDHCRETVEFRILRSSKFKKLKFQVFESFRKSCMAIHSREIMLRFACQETKLHKNVTNDKDDLTEIFSNRKRNHMMFSAKLCHLKSNLIFSEVYVSSWKIGIFHYTVSFSATSNHFSPQFARKSRKNPYGLVWKEDLRIFLPVIFVW